VKEAVKMFGKRFICVAATAFCALVSISYAASANFYDPGRGTIGRPNQIAPSDLVTTPGATCVDEHGAKHRWYSRDKAAQDDFLRCMREVIKRLDVYGIESDDPTQHMLQMMEDDRG
jgi:hypothetical protein